MSHRLGKSYYNAISTKHGNHIIALGWTTTSGNTVELVKDGNTDNFILKIHSDSGPSTQVLSPFEVVARIDGDPRSIFVKDDYGSHQVQINGVVLCDEGSNEPGAWFESGK